MTTGVVYIGHDNMVTLQCKDGAAAADFSAMTKVEIAIGTEEVNSNDDAALFDLSEKATGKIGLKFGTLIALTAGDYPIRVTVYDAVNDDGIVWAHEDNLIPTTLRVIKD